jgi:DNA invertase Pin-like site-specific DNA recombinase
MMQLRVGYLRISSVTQKIDRQADLMEQLGVDKVFIDVMSGKSADRPQLNEMLDFLRESDELIVESISRLARNTRDLLDIIEKLKTKGVKFVSKKENIDTSTPMGKFILVIFGGLSELERDYLLDRQADGIAAAKRRGAHLGRPETAYPEKWEPVYEKWRRKQITAVEAMKLLNLKKTVFYKMVKRYESNKN